MPFQTAQPCVCQADGEGSTHSPPISSQSPPVRRLEASRYTRFSGFLQNCQVGRMCCWFLRVNKAGRSSLIRPGQVDCHGVGLTQNVGAGCATRSISAGPTRKNTDSRPNSFPGESSNGISPAFSNRSVCPPAEFQIGNLISLYLFCP